MYCDFFFILYCCMFCCRTKCLLGDQYSLMLLLAALIVIVSFMVQSLRQMYAIWLNQSCRAQAKQQLSIKHHSEVLQHYSHISVFRIIEIITSEKNMHLSPLHWVRGPDVSFWCSVDLLWQVLVSEHTHRNWDTKIAKFLCSARQTSSVGDMK